MEHLSDKNPANSVEDGGEFTPLHFAARKGQLAVCQLMLDNLSDKNPATKTARVTPLHMAARDGHVAVCKLIMENLVDKNPISSSGTTPLNIATFFGKLEVCQLFHENGIHQEGREFEKLEIFKLFKSYEKDKLSQISPNS
jgi:ankyrin repeat protein